MQKLQTDRVSPESLLKIVSAPQPLTICSGLLPCEMFRALDKKILEAVEQTFILLL